MAKLGKNEKARVGFGNINWVKFENPGDNVEVVFKEMKEGQFGTNLIGYDTETGELVGFGLTTNLELQLSDLRLKYGDILYIEYVGEEKNPKTKRKFKKFEVYHYSAESEEAQQVLKELGLIEEIDLNDKPPF